jgi:hypothetical protein
LRQAEALARRAGDLVLEDCSAASGRQRGMLKIEILVVGGDAGITEKHRHFCA